MKRWYDISKDPNSPEVMKTRVSALASARVRRLVTSRVEYICDLVRGKHILDIGVVDREAWEYPDWLHGYLCRSATTCLGVEILEEEVEKLSASGYNVICADISNEPLHQTFEVIVCGDIIEHLHMPGQLFANVAQMLVPGGRVVLSTPTPWYINVILKNVVDGLPFTDSADHVGWFDPGTLCELGQRYGLALVRFMGVAVQNVSTFRAKLFFRLVPLFIRLGFRPELFAKTVVYEFVLVDAA